jgi:hypothetical protein
LSQLHADLSAAEFESELARFSSLREPYVGFLAFTAEGETIGMIDARERNYAEALLTGATRRLRKAGFRLDVRPAASA